MYTPNPINTANITLSDDIMALSEALAENTHEVWAAGRIAEGWTYGSVRDDAKKHNPSLVPYEELPESEKDYDRATSLETLKVILLLGYSINKDNGEAQK
jgi:hypothetical protein